MKLENSKYFKDMVRAITEIASSYFFSKQMVISKGDNVSSGEFDHFNPYYLYIDRVNQTFLRLDNLDKEILYNYICELFKEDYVNPRIQKQIAQYMKEYNYTYNGIYLTLKYWYEVKHNDITKANGGIGIVPYVYNTAYNYNYAIWLAKQSNENKVMEDYKPTVREIRIRRPERKIKKRRRFAFLDEEENK
jgi:hypothetical protein